MPRPSSHQCVPPPPLPPLDHRICSDALLWRSRGSPDFLFTCRLVNCLTITHRGVDAAACLVQSAIINTLIAPSPTVRLKTGGERLRRSGENVSLSLSPKYSRLSCVRAASSSSDSVWCLTFSLKPGALAVAHMSQGCGLRRCNTTDFLALL